MLEEGQSCAQKIVYGKSLQVRRGAKHLLYGEAYAARFALQCCAL